MIRVLLADDHQVVREGLRLLLDAEPDMQVVGEAGDGSAAVDLTERLRPDVLVLDMMMPGLNGSDVVWQLRRRHIPTRIVILSMHADPAYVTAVRRQGALGYVLKDAGGAELTRAVREVAGGGSYLSPPLSEEQLQTYLARSAEGTVDPYDSLTPREREVLHFIADGFTNLDIARRLSISTRTVETHRANLMRKVGVRNQYEVVRYAVARGLLADA